MGHRHRLAARTNVSPIALVWAVTNALLRAVFFLRERPKMLAMKKDQMEVFEAGALKSFEHRTLRHLQAYFPAHCKLVGEEAMRNTIRLGWSKCVAHRLTPECCARSYIEFMCLLGSGFDADPLLPWAGALLADRSIIDPVERGDLLHERAWDHLRRVAPDYDDLLANKENSRFIEELRQLNALADDPMEGATAHAVSLGLFRHMGRVFPAKTAIAGDAALHEASVLALEVAQRCNIRGERGMALIALLSLLAGTSFDQDPLLPWVKPTLSDLAQPESQRVDRLIKRGIAELKRWWHADLHVMVV